jgi:hypothetical protein
MLEKYKTINEYIKNNELKIIDVDKEYCNYKEYFHDEGTITLQIAPINECKSFKEYESLFTKIYADLKYTFLNDNLKKTSPRIKESDKLILYFGRINIEELIGTASIKTKASETVKYQFDRNEFRDILKLARDKYTEDIEQLNSTQNTIKEYVLKTQIVLTPSTRILANKSTFPHLTSIGKIIKKIPDFKTNPFYRFYRSIKQDEY